MTERVIEIFKEITRIPRESGHEENMTAWLSKFAEDHGLEHRVDEVGNVVIVRPASPGKENVPTLVLQSHTDMVCEKRDGVEHDFSKDPIHFEIEDGWMVAHETTLGADCGIGVASELAILESGLPTGRIECLFTVSEETGLDGAKAMKPGFITGDTLINLDSEDEGELFIGCAGGLDTTAVFTYSTEALPEGWKAYQLKISNCMGGHSGDDINKGRANAVQLLARFLYSKIRGLRLCAFNGGNKRNAIAHTAVAVVAVNEGCSKCCGEALSAKFAKFIEEVRKEYSVTEPNMEGTFAAAEACEMMVENDSRRIITSLCACPHGVLAMSQDIPGFVETSTNLASVKMIEGNKVRVGSSQRSSINSARKAAGEKITACFELAGAEVTHESEYPGWKPKMDSNILEVSKKAYVELFGYEPVVRAIHAGLECGLFLETFPQLDMISFGPTLREVHAPGERLDLASLEKFVKHLTKVVTEFA